MTILGPLPWSTTSAATRVLPSAPASAVTAPASSTRSTAGSVTDSPGAAVTRSTSSVSPTATFCWWPPVRTIAYTVRLLEVLQGSTNEATGSWPDRVKPPTQTGHSDI